ncbi:hypothetical protein PCC7424_1351 [Gloeothece citriformis PCC 7424]|uniref:Uncharacterized protein n=1 Tax=Gloeothece citriformis (strain PCC 7424) TaxID=65393 RepID=B7K7M7_GLOC7|nr:hypothetical protein [Gloeothece citriformis]ACK69795.1 hypothetical protein PCC7424_1351 [Gloeothece citriformis PCC 7424]
MALLSKINFRRIITIFLLQLSLILGINFGLGNNLQALAQSVNKEITATPSGLLNDAQIEAAKERRRENQAQRSEKAAEERGRKFISGKVEDKLNLDEPLPESTKKFVKQLKGEEGINNETHPEDN